MANGFGSEGMNKLLISLLSGAGQDLLAGSPVGANVNAITQKQIRAENYAGLLQKMLAGGGKVTMDRDNVNIKAPMQTLQDSADPQQGDVMPSGRPAPGAVPSGVPGLTSQVQAQPQRQLPSVGQNDLMGMLLGGVENPSASPLGNLTSSDLAGLTPEDIQSIVQLKNRQDLIQQRAVETAADQALRGQRLQLQQQKLMQDENIGFKDLPTDAQSYLVYVRDAESRGEEVMSYNDFVNQVSPGAMVKYYEEAQRDPEGFGKWYEENRPKGTTVNIGQQVAKQKALNWVKLKGTIQKQVNDHLESVRTKLFGAEGGYDNARIKEVIDFMEGKLGNEGEVIGRELSDDKSTVTWTVRLPSGEIDTISQRIK